MINARITRRSILLAAALSLLTSLYAAASDIVVEISGFRKDAGIVRTLLFNSSKGFPSDHFKAVSSADGMLNKGKASVVFKNVTAGIYAVSAFHDENFNSKLDSNFLGIPKEGIGISNNPQTRFGPPSFKQAQFTVSTATVKLEIKMNYMR